MTGRRSTRGLRGVLERRRAELAEQAGAKTEADEVDPLTRRPVSWPLERDDPEREPSGHPGVDWRHPDHDDELVG
jgi:hypothetical protein